MNWTCFEETTLRTLRTLRFKILLADSTEICLSVRNFTLAGRASAITEHSFSRRVGDDHIVSSLRQGKAANTEFVKWSRAENQRKSRTVIVENRSCGDESSINSSDHDVRRDLNDKTSRFWQCSATWKRPARTDPNCWRCNLLRLGSAVSHLFNERTRIRPISVRFGSDERSISAIYNWRNQHSSEDPWDEKSDPFEKFSSLYIVELVSMGTSGPFRLLPVFPRSNLEQIFLFFSLELWFAIALFLAGAKKISG